MGSVKRWRSNSSAAGVPAAHVGYIRHALPRNDPQPRWTSGRVAELVPVTGIGRPATRSGPSTDVMAVRTAPGCLRIREVRPHHQGTQSHICALHEGFSGSGHKIYLGQPGRSGRAAQVLASAPCFHDRSVDVFPGPAPLWGHPAAGALSGTQLYVFIIPFDVTKVPARVRATRPPGTDVARRAREQHPNPV